MNAYGKKVRASKVLPACFFGLAALGLVAWLSGCQSTDKASHAMTADTGDHTLGCQMCYDEIVKVKRNLPQGKGVPMLYTSYSKHQCPDCKAMMEIYGQDGKLMFKCGKCTPEGVACDKCLPPKAG